MTHYTKQATRITLVFHLWPGVKYKSMAPSRNSRPPILFSTDLTGIFAHKPELFYQLFQTISADCIQLDGVELMPFRFSSSRVVNQLQRYNLPIVGLHGPPAWNVPTRSLFYNLVVSIFAAATPNLSSTFRLNDRLKPQYFLIHEPDLDQPQIKKAIINHFHTWTKNKPEQNKPWLMVENVYRPQSLQLTVKKVNQLHRQTKTSLMLDLSHLLHQVTGLNLIFSRFEQVLDQNKIDDYWQLMIKQADLALAQVPKAGFHIPLGDTSDGLPDKLLTTKHWRQLAALIAHHHSKILVLVIENQHRAARLSLTEKFLPELIKDKKKKLQKLIQAGIFESQLK